MFHGAGWWSYIRYDDSKDKPKVNRALLRRVLAYARPYSVFLALSLVIIIITSILGLISPLIFREMIDDVLPNGDTSRLNVLALVIVAIPFATGLLGVAQRYFNSRTGEGIILDLRWQMYQHMQWMSLRFFTETKAGEVISRFSSDVVGAQSAIVGTIPTIVTNIVTLVAALTIMISIEWRLTLLSLALFPLFILPARRVARALREIRRQSMEHNAEMTSHIRETLSISGALLMKTFGRQRQELKKYRESAGNVADIGVRRSLVSGWFFLGLSIISAVGTALIYWLGGHFVINGDISIGTIVAFVSYVAQIFGPITALSNLQVQFATAMVSFERVFEYMDMEIEIQDKPDAHQLEQVHGRIRFLDISFTYTSDEEWEALKARKTAIDEEDVVDLPTFIATRRYAIQDVSLSIEPGQLVALVGPSGAGKTTITYLLPRLYDPTAGLITLDGYDLRDVTQESLAAQIGMVTQETYLFHDTIRANLLYARPEATAADLESACRAANIHDFIISLPEGYDTMVGERGYRLSGGEKQRLAIARVILKDPCVLILDEATSHLDSTSEALIQAALEPLLEGRTSLVIAHRLSTILAADQILVLDQGQLVEQGNHDELMARGGLYAQLYKTQFRRE